MQDWLPSAVPPNGRVEHVAALLRDAIMVGDLAPGAPLRQDHIAGRLGLSHIPVREAFRQLAGERLVVPRAKRGVAVASLDLATIGELTDLRALMEPDLLCHAIPRLRPATLAEAEALLARLDAVGGAADRLRLAEAFHAVLYAAADRPHFFQAVSGARRNLARSWRVIWDREGRSEGWQHQHRALLDLCRRGDADGAAAFLATHIQEAGAAVLQFFERETG